ncbi:hypothetical protein A6R68_11796, partial [Neotoma lepida]
MTLPTALAALVEAGMMLWAAPQPSYHSFPEGPSTVFWVAVMACTVVMSPSTMPKLSRIPLAKGSKQLVVQEALLTILSELSYFSWFTPITNVGASAEGAEMMTILAPLFKRASAFSMVVKNPVDSTTYSAPASLQLVLAASRSWKKRKRLEHRGVWFLQLNTEQIHWTQDNLPNDYLEKVKFQEYDFFIIASATRFTKLELELAKAIRITGKNYYFVRTKVDMDLENEKKCKPRTFDREKTLQQIRSYCVNTFSQNNMDVPQIFLISNYILSDYDFPVLMDTLIKDLPNQKRHNFMLSLPNTTEAAIDRKHKSMQQTIWLEAFHAGILATVPVVGIIRDDVEKLKEKLNHYQVLLGVDDQSLEVMAKDF